jgi:cytidine deaminase
MRTWRGLQWLALVAGAACSGPAREGETEWKLAEESLPLVADEKLAARIFRALDAASGAGTDPGISGFHVRCATIVERDGRETVILGGNTEYALAPEAIHGETSLMNHATNLLGAEAARRSVRFIAFYGEACGGGRSCGDCRDYLMATTNYQELLVACGQASDRRVFVQRFADGVAEEERFPLAEPFDIPVTSSELKALVQAAEQARRGGVSLLTEPRLHLGAAALTFRGRLYRAAGADDAAFHYRFPIGGVLQQAATERDFHVKAVLVAGEPGQWPRVTYRDRQYGYEFSSFNRKRDLPPIALILSDGEGRFRRTTFEDALPHAFSTGDFAPEALDRFLGSGAR